MTESGEILTTPADLALDEQLRSLQRFAPRPGFENRVMARVYHPAPVLVRARRFRSALFSPRRLWWASGLAAASSAAWLGVIGNWITGGGMAAAGAFLNTQVLVPVAAVGLQMSAVAMKTVADYALSVYGASGNAVYGLAAAAMFLPVLCSGGLYLTMQQPSGRRIATYAVR